MKRFNQFGIVCIWLFIVCCTVCISCPDVSAREPRPVCVSPIGGMVGGEPGEDPHLRIIPETKVEPIWIPEGTGGYGSSGYTTIEGSKEHLVPASGIPGSADGVTFRWWIIYLHTLSRVLSR